MGLSPPRFHLYRKQGFPSRLVFRDATRDYLLPSYLTVGVRSFTSVMSGLWIRSIQSHPFEAVFGTNCNP